MNDDFKVRAGEFFEGPLDLLLYLIEKRKLHISEISLAEITDSYMEYMKALQEESSYKDMADFVLVASTLMLIKSLSLLPSLQISPEEESSIHDLEERLKEYQEIKKLSRHIQERFGAPSFFLRGDPKDIPIVFSPTRDLSLGALQAAFWQLLQALPKKEVIPQKVIDTVVSLEEVVNRLVTRVQESFSLSFRDFVGGEKKKIDVIVSFLAMLELVRRGALMANQAGHFDDIQIETRVCDTPRYV